MNFFVVVILLSGVCNAGTAKSLSLWEYGIGLGYIQFEQYPASNQSNYLLLPFPTFQYHGKILRADDREGTRAYLFKGSNVSIELSGGGHASLDSSQSTARTGMPNLPWIISLGPQVVGHLLENLELRVKFFQATSTDFADTRFSGATTETQIVLRHRGEIAGLPTRARFSFSAKAATSEYHATYFEVRPEYANANRAAYAARSGYLEMELNYFQSLKVDKASYYIGASVNDYSQSVNRGSPLHKSDYTFSYLIGLTYTLGQSQRDSVPEQETEGILKKP